MNQHPSRDIIASKGSELKGKRVILCVTGSVAAFKAPEIARELMKHGADVVPVMTKSARGIIHPDLMEWATGNPAISEITGKIEHVGLTEVPEIKGDLILVAPATSNTISKIACGIDDSTVTSVVAAGLGVGIPVIIVPAMHESLYRHPIVRENISKLERLGVQFVGPRIEEGKAKIAEPQTVLAQVIKRLAIRDMDGLKVLITAGPTVEHLDPVRVFSNPSSGKMGMALAEEASLRGAAVTVVYGPGYARPPAQVRIIDVETTREMFEATISELKSSYYDIMIAAAAASDYAPSQTSGSKLSSRRNAKLMIELEATPKIIDSVKSFSPKTFLVVFKAEFGVSKDQMADRAHDLFKESKADLVVVNDVSRKDTGFRAETNEVVVVDRDKKVTYLSLASKNEIARKILDLAVTKVRE